MPREKTLMKANKKHIVTLRVARYMLPQNNQVFWSYTIIKGGKFVISNKHIKRVESGFKIITSLWIHLHIHLE